MVGPMAVVDASCFRASLLNWSAETGRDLKQAGYRNQVGRFELMGPVQAGYRNQVGRFELMGPVQVGYRNQVGRFELMGPVQAGYRNQVGRFELMEPVQDGHQNQVGRFEVLEPVQAGYRNQVGRFEVLEPVQAGYRNQVDHLGERLGPWVVGVEGQIRDGAQGLGGWSPQYQHLICNVAEDRDGNLHHDARRVECIPYARGGCASIHVHTASAHSLSRRLALYIRSLERCTPNNLAPNPIGSHPSSSNHVPRNNLIRVLEVCIHAGEVAVLGEHTRAVPR
jgi:hypothetical protein